LHRTDETFHYRRDATATARRGYSLSIQVFALVATTVAARPRHEIPRRDLPTGRAVVVIMVDIGIRRVGRVVRRNRCHFSPFDLGVGSTLRRRTDYYPLPRQQRTDAPVHHVQPDRRHGSSACRARHVDAMPSIGSPTTGQLPLLMGTRTRPDEYVRHRGQSLGRPGPATSTAPCSSRRKSGLSWRQDPVAVEVARLRDLAATDPKSPPPPASAPIAAAPLEPHRYVEGADPALCDKCLRIDGATSRLTSARPICAPLPLGMGGGRIDRC
jgi:hypothetical protein